MSFNHTTEQSGVPPNRRKRLDELTLPADLESCAPPYATGDATPLTDKKGNELPDLSWKDVILGVNMVTQTVFPLLHFTGDKVRSLGMRTCFTTPVNLSSPRLTCPGVPRSLVVEDVVPPKR